MKKFRTALAVSALLLMSAFALYGCGSIIVLCLIICHISVISVCAAAVKNKGGHQKKHGNSQSGSKLFHNVNAPFHK